MTAVGDWSGADPRVGWVVAGRKKDLPWNRKRGQRCLKRVMDVVGAIVLLVFLSPALLLASVLVRLTSRGPVLFVQTRVGLDGRYFRMAKLRSMIVGRPDGSACGDGEVGASDPRLTPIGGWLRATRVDEIPQLVQVLTGRMSLVGPRPAIPAELDEYPQEHMLRFAMLPGCTAWTFTRGAFANDSHARRVIDIQYIEEWSFWLDIRILVGTLWVLLRQKNTTPNASKT